MQTRSKKSAVGSKTKEVIQQVDRFKAMAVEVGADESPGALDRAFGKLDPNQTPRASAKSK